MSKFENPVDLGKESTLSPDEIRAENLATLERFLDICPRAESLISTLKGYYRGGLCDEVLCLKLFRNFSDDNFRWEDEESGVVLSMQLNICVADGRHYDFATAYIPDPFGCNLVDSKYRNKAVRCKAIEGFLPPGVKRADLPDSLIPFYSREMF